MRAKRLVFSGAMGMKTLESWIRRAGREVRKLERTSAMDKSDLIFFQQLTKCRNKPSHRLKTRAAVPADRHLIPPYFNLT